MSISAIFDRMIPSSSLRLKLVTASLVVQVAMLALLVANSVYLAESQLLDLKRRDLQHLTSLLNASLARPLERNDRKQLKELLDAVRSEQELEYLVVRDNDGKIVADAGWNKAKLLPTLSKDLASSAKSGESRFDTVVPISRNGVTLGTLRLGVSMAFLGEARSKLLLDSGGFAGAAVLFSMVLLFASAYWLTRHLAELNRASKALTEGRFDESLAVTSRDEIGELTETFNVMAHTLRDRVEDLKHSEQAKATEHARLSALLSALDRGILFVGTDEKVVYSNPAFSQIWKIPGDTRLVGMKMNEVKSPCATTTQFLNDHVAEELREIETRDGRVVTQVRHPVTSEDSQLTGYIWVYEDVTRDRETAKQLVFLAERDALTGLFNRHRFQQELDRQLAQAKRDGTRVALLFFDLDEFKYVNDYFGHHAGDALLVRIAGEVNTQVRKNEIFARLGGDEFAIVAPATSDDELNAMCERILAAIARTPFRVGDQNLRLTTSLGVAVFPDHAANSADLVAFADSAMYQAKDVGKNTWRIYRDTPGAQDRRVAAFNWNDRIHHALENNLLRLHFQGVFSTASRKLTHVEALIRMVDADGKVILPGQFIPIAEKTGKVLDLDRWVIRKSVDVLASASTIPPIAINISGRSFNDPSLPQFIASELARREVAAHRLYVELTETSAVSDLTDAQRFIASLKKTGCKVCLDDFGAGFSSFTYLKHLNVDALKIDGEFVRNLSRERENTVFIKSMVDVARALNKSTIAECVEDEQTLKTLKAFGVEQAQGYYLERPREDHPSIVGKPLMHG
ncbi:MAG: EAL domain-containing protein [Burkholderiales bacterium]